MGNSLIESGLKEIDEGKVEKDEALRCCRFLPIAARGDKVVMLKFVRLNGLCLEYASKELQDDEDVVSVACEDVFSYLQFPPLKFASERLRKSKEVVMKSVKECGLSLKYALKQVSEDGRTVEYDPIDDEETVLLAVKYPLLPVLEYASDRLRGNKEIVLEAVKSNGNNLEFATEILKGDKDVVIESVKSIVILGDSPLRFASEDMRDDRDVVMTGIENTSIQNSCLKYASNRLKSDRVIVLKSMSKSVDSFEHAADNLKLDRDFVCLVLETFSSKKKDLLRLVGKDVRKDKKVVMIAVQHSGANFEFCSKQLQDDTDVATVSIQQDPMMFKYASPRIRGTRSLALLAVESDGNLLSFVSDELKGDYEVVVAAVRNQGLALEHASSELKNNRSIVLKAVKSHGYSINYASETFQKDREVSMESVRNYGLSLQFLPDELKRDKEVILTALRGEKKEHPYYGLKDSHVLQYISDDSLYDDRDVILEGVKMDGSGLKFASERLRNDREIVEMAFSKGIEDHALFEIVSERLKDDKELVVNVVKNNAFCFIHCSDRLKNDRDVALLSVSQSPSLIEHASEAMRDDKELFMFAIQKQHHEVQNNDNSEMILVSPILQYASDRLKNDYEVCELAVCNNHESFLHFGPEMKKCKELVLVAVRLDGSYVEQCPEEMRSDPEIIAAAMETNDLAVLFAGEKIRGCEELGEAETTKWEHFAKPDHELTYLEEICNQELEMLEIEDMQRVEETGEEYYFDGNRYYNEYVSRIHMMESKVIGKDSY